MGKAFAKDKLSKEETVMAQTIEECLDYLAAARESVEELSLAADREEQLKQDEARLKKSLDAEKKADGRCRWKYSKKAERGFKLQL